MSVADHISFNNFCHLCKKIKNGPKEKKFNILNKYIKNWKKKGEELKLRRHDLDDSFYPVLRLLLPYLDRDRGAYGVKEVALARIYIRILSLPKDGRDAIKLLDFRAPKTSGRGYCDFAEVAYWILKSRCAEGSKLSINEINQHLDRIATSHALNEAREVDSALVSLLTATSAEEQKWIIRILLKEIKLGLSQNLILNCYHPDAKDLYEATNNLRKICDTLKDPTIRLNEVEIELFSPFRPMLSEECDIQKINSYISKCLYFYIETKLDGERFQIHMTEGCYKYFSRNGYDYTSNFGGSGHEGSLTPRLANRFQAHVRSCILDGEMMTWNINSQCYGTKANNVDVKSLKESDVYQPCFCAFDILFCNGQVLTNKPLHSRLEILQNSINTKEGAIVLVSQKRISSGGEVIESLNEAIDNCEEGIVMKEFTSVYKPNVRKNGGWYKVKPEYVDGLSETLDLLIIGGYYGGGRHKGNISHFLLGILVNNIEGKKFFYSTGKVGSGYSMNQLNILLSQLQPHWLKTEAGKMPDNIHWTKEKPDVWIEPSKSFILEIKAAEIVTSDLFKSGCSLRFPRVEKIRYDKSWDNCLTLEELMNKKMIAAGKLAMSHFKPSEISSGIPKKKSKTTSFRIQNNAQDTSDILRISDLLLGKEICVFSGFEHHDRGEIERKIIEFGGTIVKNPGRNTFCILAEDNSTARTKNVVQCGSHDIIITSWFYSQLQTHCKVFPDLKPEHFVALSSERKNFFSENYDEFGDHYTSEATRETLSFSMNLARRKVENFRLTSDDFYNLDTELFNGTLSPYGIFRFCWAYFDRFLVISNYSSETFSDLDNYKIDYQFRGGKCVNVINDQTTHVIIYSKNLCRLKEFQKMNRIRERKFHIVTEKWIVKSIREGIPSNETGF